ISGTDTSLWALPWSFTVSASGVGLPGTLNTADPLAIFPNPATGHAQLSIALHESEYVHVELLDIFGRQLRVLFDGQADGTLQLNLRRADLPGGIYLIRAVTSKAVLTGKLIFR
ncbi:MAG: T9SS type A sorting domain-containing protein, partial [Flavobacteriales bacterium]